MTRGGLVFLSYSQVIALIYLGSWRQRQSRIICYNKCQNCLEEQCHKGIHSKYQSITIGIDFAGNFVTVMQNNLIITITHTIFKQTILLNIKTYYFKFTTWLLLSSSGIVLYITSIQHMQPIFHLLRPS